jgi:hypothetical protein
LSPRSDYPRPAGWAGPGVWWRAVVAQLLSATGQELPCDDDLRNLYERGISAREAAGLALADVLLATYTVAGEGT